MSKKYQILYLISLICISQYIITTSILFYFYEGGARSNFDYTGYVFFENFLSDLGREVNFRGANNATAPFYALTLSFVGVGTLCFFLYLKQMFDGFLFSKIGGVTGACSGISLALVGLFAVDQSRTLHLSFLGVGYILFFITLVGYNVLMYKEKQKFKKVLLLTSILNLGLLTYIFILIFGGDPASNMQSLSLQVVAQKIIVYGQLIILGLVLVLLRPSILTK
ncbi:MAG: hypothetical protein ACI8Q1_001516 [Parvicella sp.]|jgi:hypothetical protein